MSHTLFIILVMTDFCVQTAQGHGDAINDITVHPTRPSLFVTASRVSCEASLSHRCQPVCPQAITSLCTVLGAAWCNIT